MSQTFVQGEPRCSMQIDKYDIGNSLVNMPTKAMLSHQNIQIHHHNATMRGSLPPPPKIIGSNKEIMRKLSYWRNNNLLQHSQTIPRKLNPEHTLTLLYPL